MCRGRAIAVLVCCCVFGSTVAGTPPFLPSPRNGQTYVIAHRGAHEDAPENTLAAYRAAIALGADFVEIDLRTTKDGQFVSIHNRTVDAYTTDGTSGAVRSLTLDELRAIDIGSRIHPRWKDERVPTLEEILTLCRDRIGIYLDLKDAAIPRVTERIRSFEMQKQVVWCIAPGRVAELRECCPECLPMPDPETESTLPRMIRTTQARVVAPVWSDFSPTFAAPCHAAGALVFVDEDSPQEDNWRQALDWGADGIQTDDPAGLIRFLRQRARAGDVE